MEGRAPPGPPTCLPTTPAKVHGSAGPCSRLTVAAEEQSGSQQAAEAAPAGRRGGSCRRWPPLHRRCKRVRLTCTPPQSTSLCCSNHGRRSRVHHRRRRQALPSHEGRRQPVLQVGGFHASWPPPRLARSACRQRPACSWHLVPRQDRNGTHACWLGACRFRPLLLGLPPRRSSAPAGSLLAASPMLPPNTTLDTPPASSTLPCIWHAAESQGGPAQPSCLNPLLPHHNLPPASPPIPKAAGRPARAAKPHSPRLPTRSCLTFATSVLLPPIRSGRPARPANPSLPVAPSCFHAACNAASPPLVPTPQEGQRGQRVLLPARRREGWEREQAQVQGQEVNGRSRMHAACDAHLAPTNARPPAQRFLLVHASPAQRADEGWVAPS